MSFHSAIIERARSFAALDNLIDGRIAFESGVQGWARPYIILEAGPLTPELTFGRGEDLTTARVYVNLYANTGAAMFDLETAWRVGFNRFSGVSDGLKIDSWITASYDGDEPNLETDTQSRVRKRVIENMFAYIPTFEIIPPAALVDFDPAD